MDPIERGLQQEIPIKEAAAFFLELKYGKNPEEKLASRDISVVREKVREHVDRNKEFGKAVVEPAVRMAHHAMGKQANMGMGGAAGAGGMGALPPPPASMSPVTPPPLPATAKGMNTAPMGKMAEKMKRALSEMLGDGGGPGSVAPEVDMNEYMANEQDGRAAEEENQASFLRERLQATMAELSTAQGMASTAQQTAEQLQMAQAQHEQQLQAAQQQSQLATDAAMQNVQQAHELALKATTQALQAKDDAINTHQLAAQMRMSYQDMRGSIMDAVAQDAAAPIGEAIKQKGMESQSVPPQGEEEAAGQNGSGPDPGAEGAPKEGGQGDTPDPDNVNKDAKPQEQAGGEGGPPAAAAPNSIAPASGGPEHANQANADGGGEIGGANPMPNSMRGTKDQPGVVSTDAASKQASVKLAGPWGSVFQSAMGHLKENAPYAAAGGALGAALPFVESHMGHDKLRGKVKELEESGEGGFGHALNLAQNKIRLSLGELSEKHPGAMSVAGGVMGAAAGATMGPHIMEGFKALPGRINELRGKAVE
jgi:hypothetical protein